MAKEQEKWVGYAAQISDKIAELFEDELDINEIDLTQFIHAYASAAPSVFFQKVTGQKVDDFLEFNHIANRLIIQFQTEDK
jgi:hypothetical protein